MNNNLDFVIQEMYSLADDNDFSYLKDNNENFDEVHIINDFNKLIELYGFDLGNKYVELTLTNSEDFKKALNYILKNKIVEDIEDTVISESKMILAFPIFTNIDYNLNKKGNELFEIINLISFDYELIVRDTDYPKLFNAAYCNIKRHNDIVTTLYEKVDFTFPVSKENLEQFVFEINKLMQISEDLDFLKKNVDIDINKESRGVV